MKKETSKLNWDASRRQFIKTMGGAGLSTSLLKTSSLAAGMMLGRSAIAAGASDVCRVVFVYTPGGAPFVNDNSLFNPSANLALPVASAPMESVKNECVFFNDVAVSGGGGHGYTQKVLGASVRPDTIDVALADTLGANTPFPLLLLGVQSNNGNHGFATQRAYRALAYQDNPIATFNRVFAGSDNSGGSGGASIDTLRAQSVLDIQKAEIAELQSILGNEERQRLETHLASIETIERRLQAQSQDGGNGSGDPGAFNPDNFAYNSSDTTTFTRVSDLQMDLAVLALQANQTRVISVMLGNHQSDHSVPELNWSDTYHQSIHGAGEQGVGPHIETRAYLSRRFTYLVAALRSATDEFGNSLLDSTLVVQVTDMADGNNHTTNNAPMLLAGGGSAINRGQSTRCGQHVNIFDTVTEVLGLAGQIPRYGNGPISGVIA